VSRDLVYGRRPVREALRGPREVLELWATERALKAERDRQLPQSSPQHAAPGHEADGRPERERRDGADDH